MLFKFVFSVVSCRMKLNDFFSSETARRAGYIERRGKENPPVTGLEYDSRRVKPGNLYFALPGFHADGHDFIAAALKAGAAAVIHQKPLEECKGLTDFDAISPRDNPSPVFIRVRDSRFAMSPVAAAFHGFPGQKLILAAVTGTEGKSTTVYLIWQLLRLSGKKTGFISTVQYSDGGEALWNPEHQTTPEATAIQLRLAEMAAHGTEYGVIEASSHGLSPRTNRLGDVFFDAAVMTNVTHEHLEFHGTWEQYRQDKANLFRSLDTRAEQNSACKKPAEAPFGVINADDKSASYFAAATKQKTYTFSTSTAGRSGDLPNADLRLSSIESGAGGNRYQVDAQGKSLLIEDKLPGAFNAGNVLAALLTVSHLLGKGIEELIPLVSFLKPVRGRMTPVNRGQNFEVLIDYAHTPSSFEAIFPPLRSRLDKTGGRIISLFGSAGERDTSKRPRQGQVAARYSDILILSDEDPRGEEPAAILEEIAGGIFEAAETGRRFRREENLFLIPDRTRAIRKAFSLAQRGDLVLLLGKGHENSIIYKDRTMRYDEIAEAEKALEEMGEKL
jgi:UDP-N-acetylmuramoyl-L-alanyl-D-glutamate--2,6-diaminopimelate ligase